MNKKIRFFIIYVLPVIIFGSLILYFSSQPKEVIKSILIINQKYEKVDGPEHLFLYGLFSLFVYRLFKHTQFKNKTYTLTIIFIVLFSLIDETLQFGTPTRDFSLIDIMWNIIGSFINFLREMF